MENSENQVFVGKKGTMSYVLAVVTQFNNDVNEVTVKARGKAISRAVDVAEIVRHRFLTNVKIQGVSIGTEELTAENGEQGRVSCIDITLSK